MESKSSTLLSVCFTSRFEREASTWSRREPRLPKVEGPGLLCTNVLEEIPEWAPRRDYPRADRLAASAVDHYESWQGICW